MISVCIPVRDGGPEFEKNLFRWTQQETPEQVEILVLDSGSRDSTPEKAQRLGARVHALAQEKFNHGQARNHLAEMARGDVLVFTVADAAPLNPHTLVELTRPLREDPELAAVTGKEVPRPDADLIAQWEIESSLNMLNPHHGRWKKRLPPAAQFSHMGFCQQIAVISFDNVCSAMRREVWKQFPFSAVEFAEDLDWSYRVMKSGRPILSNPYAQVLHSHGRSPWGRLRHYFVGRYRMNTVLGVLPQIFPWSEEEAFAAVRDFRVEVSRVRKAVREASSPVPHLRIPRHFRYACFRAIEKWGPLALGGFHQSLLRPYAREWLQSYFNYICWCILRRQESLTPQQALFVVDHAEAQAVGDFLGQCYYRSKRLNCLSSEFAQLGWLLRRHFGVVFDESPTTPSPPAPLD